MERLREGRYQGPRFHKGGKERSMITRGQARGVKYEYKGEKIGSMSATASASARRWGRGLTVRRMKSRKVWNGEPRTQGEMR